ncbi:uncharacterized protein B0H18DRAFT_1217510 [Fomitopsis serialis]|uniref:uncharacterized protein n=1 Tax=Fomitopsis serialis TaxID=139415 RepID=UPI0020082197|nr:uncharacterized protein B0H18DRAFT_1217510 [Neoantrodia serialis]KAH9911885.1 hypothetical protein B0H18DRAFT_1217510 [Neoantrodia serialis]
MSPSSRCKLNSVNAPSNDAIGVQSSTTGASFYAIKTFASSSSAPSSSLNVHGEVNTRNDTVIDVLRSTLTGSSTSLPALTSTEGQARDRDHTSPFS